MSEAAFYPSMHSRNQGTFYRGARGVGAKQGTSLGAMGRGIYLSWDEGMAEAFARMVDGRVYTYKVAPGLKLLDAQSREMAEIKASMGFAPHEYSDDPMYTTVVTNAVKDLGYDGVISDKLAEGLVLFDPTMAQLIEGPVKPNRARLPTDHPHFEAANTTVQMMRDGSSRKQAIPQEAAVQLFLQGYDAKEAGISYGDAPKSVPGLFWRAGYYAYGIGKPGGIPNPSTPFLPEDPWSYFHPIPRTEVFLVADLVHGKGEYLDDAAHLKSTQTAGHKMAEAAQGIIPTRRPIALCDNQDGTYTVMDGNATFAQAVLNGWEHLPGVVEQVGDCPQPMRRNMQCPHCREHTDRYRTSWDIPGEGYACPKCEGQARLPIWPRDRPEAIAHQEKQRRGNPLAPYKLEVEGDAPGATLAQALARGVEKASDICKITPPLCVGNLGVPRDQMPQLREAVIPAYLESLERQGHHVHKASVPVGHLKATQREINANKVLGMLESFRAGRFPSITAPVVVSTEADGSHHILDGHHRWATLLIDAPQNEMEVHLVSAPIRELLLQANLFEGVTQAAF